MYQKIINGKTFTIQYKYTKSSTFNDSLNKFVDERLVSDSPVKVTFNYLKKNEIKIVHKIPSSEVFYTNVRNIENLEHTIIGKFDEEGISYYFALKEDFFAIQYGGTMFEYYNIKKWPAQKIISLILLITIKWIDYL